MGLANTVFGDPVGKTIDVLERANASAAEQKRKSEPAYQLAEEKMRLYNIIEGYEGKLEWAKSVKADLMIELYTKFIGEYKEKLKLLS